LADRNFLSWIGFKGEESEASKKNPSAGSASLDRIRELESQLNDLRSRRDITGLSKEEFEILATETAMSLIRAAQQREVKANEREVKANASAEKLLSESKKVASSTLEQAEARAESLLSHAESRGREYIKAAESDASDILAEANSRAEELLGSKKREGEAITTSARREADHLILEASTEVSEYRNWLEGFISEAERIYQIQSQSLDSAESAISQSRRRLERAFNRLAELQEQVVSAISSDSTPSADAKEASRINAAGDDKAAKKSSGKKSATKKRR